MRLRAIAMTALLIGAAGSVSFMARTGRHQRSVLIVLMFTLWVLSPFVALAVANALRARLSAAVHTAIYGAMIGVSFVCLSVYTLAAIFPRPKPAAVFILVPGACWVLIVLAMGTAAVVGRGWESPDRAARKGQS